MHAPDEDITALEKLAAELAARGLQARLMTPDDRLPSLTVTNPQAAMLDETVITSAEWFWWSWGDRIAAVADVAAAAEAVARVLGTS